MVDGTLPIQQQERSGVVDALRGFALAGVILANLFSFVTFVMPAAVVEASMPTIFEKILIEVFTVVVENKFVTLFSLLFGYGFGVIMERAEQNGVSPVRFFSRRMTILFLVGVLHLFVWWGEILHAYALCGIFLLLFRKVSNKGLLIAAAFLLLVPPMIVRYVQIQQHAFDTADMEKVFAEYLRLSREPDFLSMIKANAINAYYINIQCLIDLRDFFLILAKFLVGYYILRKGYLKDLTLHKDSIRRLLFWCAPIAVLYMAEMSYLIVAKPKIENLPLRLLLFDFNRLGELSLAMSYACLIALLYHRWSSSKILSAFQYVGMMSLTNYLTQTIVFIVLLNGIGFGLMGSIQLMYMIPIAIGIYVTQAFISRAWLSKFRYGPAEWVWRQLSYGRRFPLRK